MEQWSWMLSSRLRITLILLLLSEGSSVETTLSVDLAVKVFAVPVL